MQNPYWVAKRMNRINHKHRYMTNASLKYQITPWLDVTGRLRFDRTNTKFEDQRYASTINLFAHSPYGFYKYENVSDQALYGDLMANINKTLGDFSIGANIGGSFQRTQYEDEGYQGGLKAPSNLFTPNAIDYAAATNDNRPIYGFNKHYINSLFANAELGWKSMLFLTLTGRNDWDSALAGTKHESFFYPSVGMSAIISQMVQLPEFISYMKVRGSWASVGSAISPNIASRWRYEYNPASQSYSTVTYKFPETFYPERTNSWEAGLTARFFDNALTLDVTFYQSNTRKQTFLRPITVGEGYSKEYVQTGNVRNRGLELSLGYNKTWGDFTWNSSLTYSMNRNKIIDLLEDPNEVISQAGLNGANVILKKGGTMGDVYTYTDFARDNEGNIALDASGNVMRQTLSNPKYCGSVLPKGNIGFSNDFTWKGLNLGFGSPRRHRAEPDSGPARLLWCLPGHGRCTRGRWHRRQHGHGVGRELLQRGRRRQPDLVRVYLQRHQRPSAGGSYQLQLTAQVARRHGPHGGSDGQQPLHDLLQGTVRSRDHWFHGYVLPGLRLLHAAQPAHARIQH